MIDRPGFVVFGGVYDGGVYLVASKSVDSVDIRSGGVDIGSGGATFHSVGDSYFLPRSPDVNANVRMRDYVTVTGDTYAEAWAALLALWTGQGGAELVQYPASAVMLGLAKGVFG